MLTNLRQHDPQVWVSTRDLERTTGVNTATHVVRRFIACGWVERRQRAKTLQYATPLEYRVTTIGLTAARTRRPADALCHNETPAETYRRLLSVRRAELTAKVVAAYRKGASIRTVAARCGVSYGLVHKLLTEAGEPLRPRGGPRHPRRRAGGSGHLDRTAGASSDRS